VLHAQQASFPFQDVSLPVDKRIDDSSGMILEEKASQMVNRTRAILDSASPNTTCGRRRCTAAGGGSATVFPATGLGATFDAPKLNQMACLAAEGRVSGTRPAGRARGPHDGEG
jgi:hypothetical protein